MKVLISLLVVLVLVALAYWGVEVAGMTGLFGTIIPYAAALLFVVGFVWRIVGWARTPVPFRIPTTCGQQRSLPWIKPSPLENPSSKAGVVGRMLLEVLLFRSLARNTVTRLRSDGDLAYTSTKWLWGASLIFHYCFLIVVLRHLRFFTEPVPACVSWLASLDGFLLIGVPTLLLSGAGLALAAAFLFLRRLASPQLRYGSLAADYFPLLLVIGIALTGLAMRHVVRTDITAAKEHLMGLVSFGPAVPAGIHWLFYAHLLLVSVLLIYIPMSKLMHMGGVFFRPTRNLANDNRARHHANPWDYPVKVHPYDEYEDEFREKMKAAGIPVEKE